MLSRKELANLLQQWEGAWNRHDLEGVIALFHEDVLFDNWSGARVQGKERLRRAWMAWFADHGDFRFAEEETFIDEETQKVLYRWRLEWASPAPQYRGQREVRRGVDILHFADGKIIQKLAYCKTTVTIAGNRVALVAE